MIQVSGLNQTLIGHWKRRKRAKRRFPLLNWACGKNKRVSEWAGPPLAHPSALLWVSSPGHWQWEVSFPLPPEKRWVMWWQLFQHLLEFCFVLFSTSFWEALYSLEVQQNCLSHSRQTASLFRSIETNTTWWISGPTKAQFEMNHSRTNEYRIQVFRNLTYSWLLSGETPNPGQIGKHNPRGAT